MKKMLMALGAVGSLALAACGNDDGNTNNTNTNNTNNNSGCLIEANFTSIHDNLLSSAQGCAANGCHASNSAFGGLDLGAGKAEVYRQLTEDPVTNTSASVTERIAATGDASYLYIRVTAGDSTGAMPPALMATMPACQQQAIKDWIDGGAPND